MNSLRVLMLSRPSLFEVPGGDTVQLSETARALETLGCTVTIKGPQEKINYEEFDILHLFNLIRPNVASYHIRKSKLPFVISTIFVDYTEIERNYRSLPFRILSRLVGSDGLDYLKSIGRMLINGEPLLDAQYLWKGHKATVEKLLNEAKLLLPNSESEFQRLKCRYRFKNNYTVIPNAVGNDFVNAEPKTETNRKGVVCIARIEFIKNQLNLIKAIKDTDIPLKLIGKAAPNHKSYERECREEATSNIQFLGQMDKEAIKRELASAEVHILPSWFETTGLSSLEAAAMGCKVIVSPRGDTKEYFGDKALYCDPASIDDIRIMIEKALSTPYSPILKQHVINQYRWEIAAKKTKKAYQQVLNKI